MKQAEKGERDERSSGVKFPYIQLEILQIIVRVAIWRAFEH